MGNTYEVYEYHPSNPNANADGYVALWAGEEFMEALQVMIRAKERGAGCLKLEWR